MATLTGKQAGKVIEVFAEMSSDRAQAMIGSGLLADIRDARLSIVDRDAVRRALGLEPLSVSKLLPFPNTISLHATTIPFVVAKKFVVNKAAKAPVRIAYVGKNFMAWFGTKVEAPAPATTLRYAKLTRSSLDAPIIAELGDRADTTIADIWQLLERQPHREAGILENTGYANIFHVPDVNGMRCAVGVGWDGGGWRVNAYSVEDPYEWQAGSRIFSRNP